MKNSGLQGTFVRVYKKNGKDVFVYRVTGTKEAVTSYEESRGEYNRVDEDTKDPLWFSIRYVGEKAPLFISVAGNTSADMSEFSKAASLASQFGGNLGQELARVAAEKLMGSPINNSPVNDVVATPNELGGNMSNASQTANPKKIGEV